MWEFRPCVVTLIGSPRINRVIQPLTVAPDVLWPGSRLCLCTARWEAPCCGSYGGNPAQRTHQGLVSQMFRFLTTHSIKMTPNRLITFIQAGGELRICANCVPCILLIRLLNCMCCVSEHCAHNKHMLFRVLTTGGYRQRLFLKGHN